MRSEEFFNILDDMDERLVSEIYEDVQRPQKITAVPNSPKRLPKIMLGSAACLAVIVAAGLIVKFAAPGAFTALSGTSAAPESLFTESDMTVSLSQTSDTVSMNDSNSVNSEKPNSWFSQKHTNPWRRTDTGKEDTNTWALEFPQSWTFSDDVDWRPENYELIAVDNGTVVFAGKISDAYGSGVIIKHTENAYVAYGGLDPDTVTVSTGDTVTAGDALGNPKAFSCLDMEDIAHIKSSDLPITEEYLRSDCDKRCEFMQNRKNNINLQEHDQPDSNGIHHVTAKAGEEVKAVVDCMIVYADNGTVVTLDLGSTTAFVVYEGLGSTFPDYYVQKECKMAAAGDTIGYVGSNSDAYWFVLDNLEFEKFAEENGIDYYPTHLTLKNTIIKKP